MRKLIKPAHDDPDNSVDLFDSGRLNDFGEMYCVKAAILYCQVEEYWQEYVDREKGAQNGGSK